MGINIGLAEAIKVSNEKFGIKATAALVKKEDEDVVIRVISSGFTCHSYENIVDFVNDYMEATDAGLWSEVQKSRLMIDYEATVRSIIYSLEIIIYSGSKIYWWR